MPEDQLADLRLRLQRIEDEREIERLIACYGLLVDAGKADGAARLWATDGTFDVDGSWMLSRDAAAAVVRSDAHRGFIDGGCCHFLHPAVATVDGDDARAVCQSRLVVHRNKAFFVARAAANLFRLRRIGGTGRSSSTRAARSTDRQRLETCCRQASLEPHGDVGS